jgi:hypothetical protein
LEFIDIFADMCDTFGLAPSQLDEEECPRIFIVWNKVKERERERLVDARRWHLLLAPLFRSVMDSESAQEQASYGEKLSDTLRDKEDKAERRARQNIEAEARLAALGLNVIKKVKR